MIACAARPTGALLFLGAATAASAAATEKALPLDGWVVSNGPVATEVVPAPGEESGRALKLGYTTDAWKIVRYPFTKRGVGDWRGADRFRFDLYIDHTEPLHTLRFGIPGIGSWGAAAELPVREWIRFDLPLRAGPETPGRFAGLDRQAVEALVLRLWADRPPNHPKETIDLYFANLRLVSRADERLRALESTIERLGGSDLLSMPESSEVDRLRQELAGLSVTGFDQPEKLEAVSGKLSEIERALVPLKERAVDRSLRRDSIGQTAALLQDLGMVRAVRERVWKTRSEIAAEADEGELAKRVRALHQTLDRAAERVAELERRAAIERAYPDAGFALGIPPWPQTWRSEEGYDGPVGREVSLRAARREFEPFQLVVLAHDQALKNVRVEVSDLVSGEHRIDAFQIEVAPMGWRKLAGEAGWIADMLRPDVGRFDVRAGDFQPVWLLADVPENAAPGDYRGTVTVTAEGLRPESVDLRLQVWPFTLPKFASMPTATNFAPARADLEIAKAIIERRWNPFQMYQWGDGADPAMLRQQTDLGAGRHNLLRISRNAAKFGQDENGDPIVTNKQVFYERLDPIVAAIRENDPGLWPHVLLYGFDEPSLGQARAMDAFYGDLKARYHDIPTLFADLYGIWASFMPENVDIWAVNRGTLTPNARDRIQEAGMEVWWYNAYNNPEDPVGIRSQFWATLKDELDGVVFYNLTAGGGGHRSRSEPWERTLRPEEERMDGGLLRIGPEGGPVPSVAFEYFREGMEDLDYLALLRERYELLAAQAEDRPDGAQRNLLREARRLLRVPDTVTTGLLGDRATDVGEVVVEMSGHTDDMNVILAHRIEIAELIVAIDEALDSKRDRQ